MRQSECRSAIKDSKSPGIESPQARDRVFVVKHNNNNNNNIIPHNIACYYYYYYYCCQHHYCYIVHIVQRLYNSGAQSTRYLYDIM